jgi:arsenite methyltransferase
MRRNRGLQMWRLGTVVALIGALPIGVAAQQRAPQHEMHRRHGDPEAYIASLEDPKRDTYQKPDEVLEALQIDEGEVVADIGAGSGYFTLRLAREVGRTGRVYAVDVSPDMILHLNRRIRDARLRNVVSLLVPPDDPLLPEASIDRFFFCDVWHHVEQQAAYLEHIRRALRPGGRIVMIDFHKKDLPVGPPVEMKIAREELIAQMKEHGFSLVKEHTFLPYQYFLVFELPGE